MDKTPAPTSVRKALVALAATVGTTVTTLVLTAAPAAASSCPDWMCGSNHNENAAADLS